MKKLLLGVVLIALMVSCSSTGVFKQYPTAETEIEGRIVSYRELNKGLYYLNIMVDSKNMYSVISDTLPMQSNKFKLKTTYYYDNKEVKNYKLISAN